MKFFYLWVMERCLVQSMILLFPLIAVIDVLRGLINPDSLPFTVVLYGESVFMMYLYWIVISAIMAGVQ